VPMFIESKHEHAEIEVPEELQDVELRGRELGDLDGKTYEASLEAESRGVKQALVESQRPKIELRLEELSYDSVGGFLAFLQYLAVYSSWLRDVDPFNQPDVEQSKKKGFEMRFEQ